MRNFFILTDNLLRNNCRVILRWTTIQSIISTQKKKLDSDNFILQNRKVIRDTTNHSLLLVAHSSIQGRHRIVKYENGFQQIHFTKSKK
jgi:hypothetical protein